MITNGRRRGLLWLVLVSWVSASIVGAGCLVYSNRVAHNSEQKWCDLVNTLHEGYQSAPQQPTTPRGQELRNRIAELKERLGCA